MKTGADISHHQKTFNAKRYKDSGQDFIILKATEGKTHVDDTFRARWRDAGARKLPRAAYHFAHPGRRMAPQADHFIKVVTAAGFRDGDAWALDMERSEGQRRAQIVDWSDQWVERVRAALGGVGLFYASASFIIDRMGSPDHIPGEALSWVARYNGRISNPWKGFRRPAAFPETAHVWQHTDGKLGRKKSVASIGFCDFNEMTDQAFANLFEASGKFEGLEDDMTTDELLKALASDRGKAILRSVISAALGTVIRGDEGTPDGGTHPDNLRNINRTVKEIKNKLPG